jgi:hypothetical protein
MPHTYDEHDHVDEPVEPVARREIVDEQPVTRQRVVEERYTTPAATAPAYAESTSYHSGYFDSLPARVNSVLFAVLVAIEGLLALRFFLVAFGASTTSGFVDFILDVSYPFMRPFENAFANRTWDEGIIEVNTLLAMGVWLLAFMLIAMLVNAVLPRIDHGETRVERRRFTHS